ncbi:MAG TPA: low molecular weight protein-tyrosine-phosphatase [Streptosporangiaceae bacterium]|nr:low molecular weight protein-tyrosine-phosphatase [Streptosporangiaceae bacterium]
MPPESAATSPTSPKSPPLPPPRNPSGPYRVLCVCLGNICRSPMAEVVLRAQLAAAGLQDRVIVDSAGTGDWHVGQTMNPPARRQLERRGYDGSAHRARQVDAPWLAERDLILAMDGSNLANLRALAQEDGRRDDLPRIRLFGEVAGLDGADVPDPWGGSTTEFAEVLTMLETGMARIVSQLRAVVGAAATER